MAIYYYTFRGVGLLMLPALLSDSVHPSMLAFIIVYGLDWVATVPPTAALCVEVFGEAGTIVFGWVFAAHQVGAALASIRAGHFRDLTSDYTVAWLSAAGLCVVAALMSLGIRRVPLGAGQCRRRSGRSSGRTLLRWWTLLISAKLHAMARWWGPVAKEPHR